MQAEATAPNADTGLLCLVLVARFLEVRANPHELQHEFAAPVSMGCGVSSISRGSPRSF